MAITTQAPQSTIQVGSQASVYDPVLRFNTSIHRAFIVITVYSKETPLIVAAYIQPRSSEISLLVSSLTLYFVLRNL